MRRTKQRAVDQTMGIWKKFCRHKSSGKAALLYTLSLLKLSASWGSTNFKNKYLGQDTYDAIYHICFGSRLHSRLHSASYCARDLMTICIAFVCIVALNLGSLKQGRQPPTLENHGSSLAFSVTLLSPNSANATFWFMARSGAAKSYS